MASKRLGPLPRTRGSTLAHGCGREGSGALPLARAAAVSTGLRVRAVDYGLLVLLERALEGRVVEGHRVQRRACVVGRAWWAVRGGPRVVGRAWWAVRGGPRVVGRAWWAARGGPRVVGRACGQSRAQALLDLATRSRSRDDLATSSLLASTSLLTTYSDAHSAAHERT